MSRAPTSSALQVLRQDDFTGGLNLRANAFQLGMNESPDLLNVDIDPRGGFASRAGAVEFTTDPLGVGAPYSTDFDPTAAMRLFAWNKQEPQLVLMTDTQFCVSDGGYGDNFSCLHDAGQLEFGPAPAQWESSAFNTSLLYVVNLNDGGLSWDGASIVQLTPCEAGEWQDDLSTPNGEHMPYANHIASHIDRMFVAGTTEDGYYYPYRLRFSHPLFPESWRESDYIDIADGGGYITGIVSFGGNLVIFKDHGLFILSGYSTDTFQLIPISLRHGCVNPLAFTELDGRLYFFDGEMGMFVFDGVNLRNISEPIAPAFSKEALFNYSAGDDWTWSEWNGVRVWAAARRIWLTDTNGTSTFVFDPTLGRSGAWTRYRLSNGNAYGHGCEFNGNVLFINPSVEYSGESSRAAVMYRDPTRADESWDGESHGFPSYYTTRWQDAGSVSVKKRWRRMDLVCKQPSNDYPSDYQLDVKAYYDWQEGVVRRTSVATVHAVGAANPFTWGSSNWGEADWGGSVEGAQYVRSASLGPSRAVQVRIAGEQLKPWGVDSITYKFNFRRVRS